MLLCALVLLGSRYLWQEFAWPSAGRRDDMAWAAGALLTGLALHLVWPRRANAALLAIALGWVGLGVGWNNLAVIGIWIAATWSLGGLLLRAIHSDGDYAVKYPVEAIIVGAATWLAVWGVMLHFKVNYQGVYWGLCLLPFVYLRLLPHGSLRHSMKHRLADFDHWLTSIPIWMWLPGIAIVGWVLRWASLPSVMFDDHALHLRMWTMFEFQHRAEFNPVDQIWSVAPFASDLLHGALSLMAGGDVRGALNLVLALMTLGLTANILRQADVTPRWQWLLLVLLASTPMFGNMLLSLQAELSLAVIALAAVSLLGSSVRTPLTTNTNHFFGVLACAALCVAIKLPGAVLGVMLLAALVINTGVRNLIHQSRPNVAGWLTLLILAFAALHSYGVAWHVTRNPTFPLYNAIFQSRFFPLENFHDTTWSTGFSLQSYIRAFFQTSKYFESGNYAAGWQYLVLLPIALLAAFLPGTPRLLRITILPLMGFGLAMFAAVQYWRYLFPVMPLAIAVMGVLFTYKRRSLRIFAVVLAVACIGLNMRYYRNISGLMQIPAQSAFTAQGREQLVRMFAPVAALTTKVNTIAPGARVLYPFESPTGATLHGQPIYTPWYAPARSLRFQGLLNAQGMADFIAAERPDFVILNQTDIGPTQMPNRLVREYVEVRGRFIEQIGTYRLYYLSGPAPLSSTVN